MRKRNFEGELVTPIKKAKPAREAQLRKLSKIEICTSCPYSTCKNGICNYFKERVNERRIEEV